MKFLISGLGSIGQRHYRNLLQLGVSDIIVYRTGKGNSAFTRSFEKKYKPKIFTDLKKALKEKPDALLVASPTAYHADAIRAGIESSIKGIFVEKPIAHSSARLNTLITKSAKRGIIGYVGYNFRFHPLLKKMKDHIGKGTIGRVISASVDMGEYLPDWHPWEDYRKTYPARKDLGGGVVLTQSHDIDCLYWFFGIPKKITAFRGTTGLDVDVDDVVKAIMEYEDGSIVSLHMDFYKRPPRKIFEVMGTKGSLLWDYYEKKLRFTPHDRGAKIIATKEPKKFDRNDMFIAEMRQFIRCLQGKEKPLVSFGDGANVLKMCEAILQSAKNGGVKSL